MEIKQVTDVSEFILKSLNELITQLSSTAALLSEEKLSEIIKSPCVYLLVAEEKGAIFGSLTLVVFTIPTGRRAWIEDVVVSESARGKGVGFALSEYAVNLASKLGAKTVDLTSRPSRVAANALYKKVGFVERNTNVYRYQKNT
ncbi:MAG: GNAT family N-acetyltransferase [Candidatus Thiodiazotropha sp.]|jgi:ribosomal protein S18 acetylase RimI-like enzyme